MSKDFSDKITIKELCFQKGNVFHKIVDGKDEDGNLFISPCVSAKDWNPNNGLHEARTRSLVSLALSSQINNEDIDVPELLSLFRLYPYLDWSLIESGTFNLLRKHRDYGYVLLYLCTTREGYNAAEWILSKDDSWMFQLAPKDIIDVLHSPRSAELCNYAQMFINLTHIIVTGNYPWDYKLNNGVNMFGWKENTKLSSSQEFEKLSLSEELKELVTPEMPISAIYWLRDMQNTAFKGFRPTERFISDALTGIKPVDFKLSDTPALSLTFALNPKFTVDEDFSFEELVNSVCFG